MNKRCDRKSSAARPGVLARMLIGCAILLIIIAAVLVLNVSFGETKIPIITVARVIASHIPGVGESLTGHVRDTGSDTIIWDIRVPRALLALFVGALLSMAGTALQGLLLNPLADPYTVGVSSGAALGAGVATLIGIESCFGGYGVPAVAFVFAMGAMFLVYALAKSAGRVSIHSFLLSGIVVGSFLWALLSFVLALASRNSAGDAQSKIIFWLLGSFEGAGPLGAWAYVRIAAPFAVLGLLALFAFARDLNLFAMGEDAARHLGIETENLKLIIITITSLITSAAVAVSGIIGFVGLVVPHICRKVFGPDHRVLLPTSALAGAVLTVLADLVSRSILPPSGLPVGIVTAMLGAPFFLYVMKTTKAR